MFCVLDLDQGQFPDMFQVSGWESDVISDIRPEITQTDLSSSDKLNRGPTGHWKLSFVTVMTLPGLGEGRILCLYQ